MAVLKCKMCGGDLTPSENASTAVCDYCGSMQTLPRMGNEYLENLYERANHLRRSNEFDKAIAIYEQILNVDSTDAEIYWSLVLCRYGIEYVEDPSSRKRIPTVNRAQFTSIFDDGNYKSAMFYGDASQKAIYEAEAKVINDIQKGILAISQQEAPFDVFICYKETDANGRRTQDSVIAQELYYELTEMGYKVFFARITLEDKLGSAYEPFIFAALNSSKVMVALGTKPEHFQAVWVKNEWSRYLALIKNGEKKMLIPAYRDMNPYDLPEEFSHLQAQDMAKLGFMQDLVRGIRKLVGNTTASAASGFETATPTNPATAPLIKRIELFLENADWESANEYCEKVLDMDPENGKVYVYQLLAQLKVSNIDMLQTLNEPFNNTTNFKYAQRFADAATVKRLEELNQIVVQNKQLREQRAREEWERKNREERIRKAREEELRKAREAEQARQAAQNAATINLQYAASKQQKIDELKKKKDNSLIGAIISIFIWWPICIFFFYRFFKFKKELDELM